MIGIIGVGGVARYAHLPAYKSLGLNCVNICDINADICGLVAEEFRIPKWTSEIDMLLDDPDVTVLDLAVPPINRAALFEKIKACGKPVLIQKPFCVTRDDYAQLLELMPREQHCRLNMTGRYVSAWIKVKNLIEAGAIGQPLSCMINNTDWWDREPGRWDLEVRDYIIYEMLVHHLDLCLYWFGHPQKVTGRGNAHPRQRMNEANRASVLLEYKNGLLVTLNEDWTLSEYGFSNGHPFEHILITGSDGAIRATSESVEFSTLGSNSVETWRLPRPGQSLPGESLKTSWFPDSFGAAMADFVTVVGSGKAMVDDNVHLRALTELTFDCAEALHSDSWIDVSPDRDGARFVGAAAE